MNEPIELTHAERNAGIEALREARSDEFGYGAGTALDTIIAAINRVREGDQRGTIRRNPATGEVAVRAAYPCPLIDCSGKQPHLSWHWIDTDGERRHARSDGCPSAREIASWPVVYRPGGES